MSESSGMVWGEKPPAKPRKPVFEIAAGLGLLALAIYVFSDPIGRSAVGSYQGATQAFIDARQQSGSLVSRSIVDAKDLAKLQGRPDAAEQSDAFIDFAIYGSVALPAMNLPTLQIAAPPQGVSTDIDKPLGLSEGEPLQIDPMSSEMELLMGDRDASFLKSTTCTRSDELSGMCGVQSFPSFMD